MTEELVDVNHWSSREFYPLFVTKLGSTYSMGDLNAKIGTMALGLAGESGEIMEISSLYALKVVEWDDELTNKKLIDELSDVCWYLAFGVQNVVETDFPSFLKNACIDKVPNYLKKGKKRYKYLKRNHQILVKNCCNLADFAKKLMYHGMKFDDTLRKRVALNLTLIAQDVANLAVNVCQCDFDFLLKHNVQKLSKRYRTLQFTTEEFLKKEASKSEND